MNALGRRIASLVTEVATAIVIVTVAIVPFLSPQWVAFEQERANSTAWTGYSTAELRTATDAILADLVLGPPDFDVEVRGEPVLGERERGHMRDVRSVFIGLWVLALVSAAVVAIAVRGGRTAGWRSVRRGALALAGAVALLGVVALVAFEVLFELFHTILFPAGSYTFDPATERLVQLFPFRFWHETAVVVGIGIIVLALLVARIAGRTAPAAGRSHFTADVAASAEPSG